MFLLMCEYINFWIFNLFSTMLTLGGNFLRKSQVYQTQLLWVSKYKVLGFNVSMNDISFMQLN